MNHREDETGSLEVGKAADFVILDRNVFEVSPDQIGETRVLATFVDGVQVYASRADAAVAARGAAIGVVGADGFTAQDCADAGGVVEAASDPHPGVCNGPVDILPSPENDSGIGALLIAPDARFATEGLPAEVTTDTGPCDTHGAGDPTLFGFVSGVSRATIADADNAADATFQHDEEGENFSCAQWMQENGPGRLVLSVPAVHGAISGDIITVFVLDD